jgi:hypothetical protein
MQTCRFSRACVVILAEKFSPALFLGSALNRRVADIWLSRNRIYIETK